MKKTLNQKEVVIKLPLYGIIMHYIICILFVLIGIVIIQFESLELRIFGTILIAYFGAMGLIFLFNRMKELIILSASGVTVYHNKREKSHLSWKNISHFGVTRDTSRAGNKCITIFLKNAEEIKENVKIIKVVMDEFGTEMPAVLFDTNHTYLSRKKVMQMLEEYFDEYKSLVEQTCKEK